MPINAAGFSIVDLGEIPTAIIDSFSRLALDQYMGNGNRYRRFSQYKMSFNQEGWNFELLAHRPYMTFSKYNPVAGGIKRFYEPIEVDFTPFIKLGATDIELDKTQNWQINVHQYRVIVNPKLKGITVPEGRHRDGHSFVMIGVVARKDISGAEMSLYRHAHDIEPFYTATLLEGQAVLLDDKRMLHDVTAITPVDEEGYRDIFVVAFSPWTDRWHGDEFEKKVIESARHLLAGESDATSK